MNLDELKIHYDNKKLSIEQMKVLIQNLSLSYNDNPNENYIKFVNFVSKLNEGIFLFRYNINPDNKEDDKEYEYLGYYCCNSYNNYYLFKTSNIDNMIFQTILSDPELLGDINVEFIYLPEFYSNISQRVLIFDVHTLIKEYNEYEKEMEGIRTLVSKLSSQIQQIIQYSINESDCFNSELVDLLTNYFDDNIKSYKYFVLN